jgi:hypothetical protein
MMAARVLPIALAAALLAGAPTPTATADEHAEAARHDVLEQMRLRQEEAGARRWRNYGAAARNA